MSERDDEIHKRLSAAFKAMAGFPFPKIVEELTRVKEVLKGQEVRTPAEDAALREVETALEFLKLMEKSCDAATGHIYSADTVLR